MQLALESDQLTLTLEGAEHLWACKLKPISVPRQAVVRAETALPPPARRGLRAPGTYVRGVIKAGTYYTDRGKEFWYVTQRRKDNPLTIELKDGPYKRLVLTIDDATNLSERINTWLKR